MENTFILAKCRKKKIFCTAANLTTKSLNKALCTLRIKLYLSTRFENTLTIRMHLKLPIKDAHNLSVHKKCAFLGRK